MNHLQYRPDIDGLRALAVISVILFHFDIYGFSGGFVGVDVFFVISGYLITSLIVKSLHQGDFSFLDFYQRRARRLLPAIVVVLLSCFVIAWFVLMPYEFRQFGKSATAFSLFASNIHFMNTAGYFDLPAQSKPLLHTWSLSVEEQFYLIFPILMVLLFRYLKGQIVNVLFGLTVLSFAISVYTVTSYPSFSYYMLPSRAWELLFGSLLAVAVLRGPGSHLTSGIAGLAGVLLILMTAVVYDKNTPFPGIAALLPCLGAVLIIWSNTDRQSIVGQFLSWRPIVFIGLISYPLYLWHWPLYVFYRYIVERRLFLHETAFLLGLVFVLSYLTWVLVEGPIRRREVFQNRRALLTYAVISIVCFVGLGRSVDILRGVPQRLPEQARIYASGAEDRISIFGCKSHRVKDLAQTFGCKMGLRSEGKVDFVLWGDSHARVLFPAIHEQAVRRQLNGTLMVYSVCRPLFIDKMFTKSSECQSFNKAVIKYILDNDIKDILVSGYWWSSIRSLKTEAMEKHFTQNFQESLMALKGRRIWVFTGVPDYKFSVPSRLATRLLFNGEIIADQGVERIEYQRYLNKSRDLFQSQSGKLNFIDAINVLCKKDKKRCRLASKGRSLYTDRNHLSKFGVNYISGIFDEMFKTISLGPDPSVQFSSP